MLGSMDMPNPPIGDTVGFKPSVGKPWPTMVSALTFARISDHLRRFSIIEFPKRLPSNDLAHLRRNPDSLLRTPDIDDREVP
jgi:hypothetical protein